MRVSRWQPFNPVWNQVQQLQNEMSQLIDRWGADGGRRWGMVQAYPPVNIWEDADAVHLEAELPGLALEDLEIYVTGGNQVTIKGERKQHAPEQGLWHREERTFGTFSRVLSLPFTVDAEKVEARFENGVLLINLPKHEAAKPRKISIKSE